MASQCSAFASSPLNVHVILPQPPVTRRVTSGAGSLMASPRSPFASSHPEECDMDDRSDDGDGDGQPVDSNDEDTDDASETESQHRPDGEVTEIKER